MYFKGLGRSGPFTLQDFFNISPGSVPKRLLGIFFPTFSGFKCPKGGTWDPKWLQSGSKSSQHDSRTTFFLLFLVLSVPREALGIQSGYKVAPKAPNMIPQIDRFSMSGARGYPLALQIFKISIKVTKSTRNTRPKIQQTAVDK